jgi:hypothetical protein
MFLQALIFLIERHSTKRVGSLLCGVLFLILAFAQNVVTGEDETKPQRSQEVKRSRLDRLQWRPSEYFERPDERNAAIAIQKRSLPTLIAIHEDGLDVRTSGKHGVTLLFWAYLEGDFEAFCQLLKWGADPNSTLSLPAPLWLSEDSEPAVAGESVAFVIANNPGHPKWLEATIRAGADIHFVSPTVKETIFSTVCGQKGPIGEARFTIENLLLEKGSDINHRNLDGRTPVMTSFAAFDWERVIYLIQRGASMSCYDRRDWQFVHHLAFHKLMAAERGGDVTEVEVKDEADPSASLFTRMVTLCEEKGFAFNVALQDVRRRNESVDGIPYMTWRRMQRKDKDACTEAPAPNGAAPQNDAPKKQATPKDR